MTDARYNKLAKLLVEYSTELKKGDRVLLDMIDVPDEFTIEMMREGWFAPTINLTRIDPQCAELDYINGEGRELQCEYVMSNNFAFGGINTSLIFKKSL